MNTHTPDPVLGRLFRHMAWANARLVARLGELDDAALGMSAPGSEWTVAMILDHVVGAAGRYVARLEGSSSPPKSEPPVTVAELPAIAETLAGLDARLGEAAAMPDGVLEWESAGGRMRRARSTLLAQAIHHATEHRAQIAGALAANGLDAIDLDDLDVWSYGDAEGLGA